MTILEAWDLYYQDKTLEGYSKTTLRGYKIQTNMLTRYFGDEHDINNN